VVARNGGSSLLKNCGLVTAVAAGVVKAVGDQVPVTAKIRIGWDSQSINAVEIARALVDCGVRVITVHGRTRAQGYGGVADWGVIDAVARAVPVPVIGNGDLASGADVMRRKRETAVAGVMIGRAAMGNPWIFREAKHFLTTGKPLPAVPPEDRWELVIRHCQLAVESGRHGDERQTLTGLRSRLMAYTKGLPGARELRQQLCHVVSVDAVAALAAEALNKSGSPD
jgi:tRNA-dihydrouridine synthase B